MNTAALLQFGRYRVPLVLQAELAECGLACLAMVASHFGYRTDLASLRSRFSLSLKGATLEQLITYAHALNFTSRALRVELDELSQLKTPCILHWNLNHFVVLTRVDTDGVHIHDPAVGACHVSWADSSARFSGVALELSPGPNFMKANEEATVPIMSLVGRVPGLWRSLGVIFLMALTLEVFALTTPLFTQWVVDEALASNDRGLLNLLVVGFTLLLLIQTSISVANGWASLYLSTHLGLTWVTNVFTHLLRLPVNWFEKRHLGDIVTRFTSVGAIQRTLTATCISAILDLLMAVGTLVLMFIYSGKLTALVIVAVVLYGLVRCISYYPLRAANQQTLALLGKEQSCFIETIRAIQTIKLFGRELDRRGRWLNLMVDYINRNISTQKIMLWVSIANTGIFGCQRILLLWLAAHMVMDGACTIGMMFAFASYAEMFTGRTSALIDRILELRMLSIHANRLSDIVLAVPEEEKNHSVPLDGLEAKIELKNVSFRYSDSEPWILRNLTLTIEPGELLAIVGPSGSGKTTLIKLIVGLLTPEEGEIRYGGIPISQLGMRAYRSQIGTVMQEDHLLAGSLAENISSFDASPDQSKIEESATIAGIHDDIVAAPMGYRTLVGDLGGTMSGGQRQRVLLARALYKRPQILVLDEATSHLDIDREKKIGLALVSLSLTRIIVAHRPETINLARRIVRIQNGTIETDLLQVPSEGGKPGKRKA